MSVEFSQIFSLVPGKLSTETLEKLETLATTAEDWPRLLRETIVPEGYADPYLADLAELELALHRIKFNEQVVPETLEKTVINPSLELIKVEWAPLLDVLAGENPDIHQTTQYLLLWRDPYSFRLKTQVATSGNLLALKIISENLDPQDVAASQNQPVGRVDRDIEKAVANGLLIAPESRLRRTSNDFPLPEATPIEFIAAQAFTLQWHITHRCDLHCRHCYDRSLQTDVSLEQGLAVLDQMREFCQHHHVYGQVSFSGGNPFMHPHFYDLYRAAEERNLSLAILGNPVSEDQLNRLLEIRKPVFYQVSLEGRQEHNDFIRGEGNFSSVFNFLELLKLKNIYSMVMLTLTQDNMGQVLPLAELLRDKVDLFTYNRLSMVGEGASLESPHAKDYAAFVREYLHASQMNPVMAMKDNLINIEREKQGSGLFGGCTGFGCGAAFNFFSLLPNGEVHACRKFPSPIGDIQQNSLREIYESTSAKAYRKGSSSCASCRLRPVCGGCLAVTYGCGLDPLTDVDPACFIDQ